MASKKGVIEVQFNWIFILIAGALIVAFFVILVQRQGTISDEKRDIDIKSKLSTILVGAKQSTGTYFIITIPKTEITYSCNGYSVGGTAPFQLGESFSPSKIKSQSNTIMLWALDWNLPYKISNFQYIVSPDVKYVLVDNIPSTLSSLSYLMPSNTSVVALSDNSFSATDLPNTNNYQIRFVTSSGDPTLWTLPDYINAMPDEDVTALKITPTLTSNPLFDNYGTLEFYKKNKLNGKFVSAGTANYIKEELVKGAIFTDNIETYNCIYKKAFEQFEITSKIYQLRTDRLSFLYTGSFNSECSGANQYYGLAASKIQNIIGSQTNLEIVYEKTYGDSDDSLRLYNQLLKKASCPFIY